MSLLRGFTISLLCYFTISLFTTPVFASSGIQKQMSITVDVKEAGDINISMQTSFFITEGVSLLREYNLAFTEKTFTNFAAVSAGGEALDYSIKENDDNTLITISLPNIRLNPGGSYAINVSYTVPAGLESIGGIYKLLVPVFNTENTTITSVLVRYPSNIGNLLYCSTECTTTNTNELTEVYLNNIKSTNPFILIGSSQIYTLNLVMDVENNSAQVNNLNTYIPIESCTQKNIVNFFAPTPSSISTDIYENNKLNVVLNPYSKQIIQYSGQVQLTSSVSKCKVPTVAALDIEELTRLRLLLETYFPNSDTSLDLIQKFYQKIISEGEINAQTGLEKDPGTNIELFLKDELHIFTQRELLEMLLFVYSAFDYPAYISYGFLYPYYVSEPIGVNYSWLTVYVTDIPKVVDPFMEIQSGISGFDVNLLDRIVIYNTQQLYDQSYSWRNLETNFVSIGYQNFTTNSNLYLTVNFPESVQAGVSHTATLSVRNNGNTLFKNLEISILSTEGLLFEFSDDTNVIPLLFPGQSITIPITINSTKGTFSKLHEVLVTYTADDFTGQTHTYSILVEQKPINILIAILVTACIGSAGVLVFERVVKYFNKNKGEKTQTPYDPLLGFGSKND
ncbi:hypothetical protein JW962_03105 [Candidatus Dojkabacteria bacterium]|nr:hypothetical protein [Candidatus Dojkabacteria bacterium]